MNINNTHSVTRFFIIDAKDPSKTLFSTMGGDKFYDHNEKNGEWQHRLSFGTQEEAQEEIDALYAKGRLLDRILAVQQFTETVTKEYINFDSKCTPKQYAERVNNLIRDKFEEFMDKNSKYSKHEVHRARKQDRYDSVELNEAFNAFVVLNNAIPQNR